MARYYHNVTVFQNLSAFYFLYDENRTDLNNLKGYFSLYQVTWTKDFSSE